MVTCGRCSQWRSPNVQDFNFSHSEPRDFVNSQIGSPWIAVAWYIVWFLYFTGTLIYDAIFIRHEFLWVVYSTNWNYMLVTMATLVEVIARVYTVVRRADVMRGEVADPTPAMKVQWLLYNVTTSISLLLTLIFLVLHDTDINYSFVTKSIITSVYAVINTSLMTSHPVKVFHFYQPMVLAVLYVLFASVFHSVHGDAAVFVLEYTSREPSDLKKNIVIACCSIVIAIPVIHVIVYCIYKLRVVLFQKCSKAPKPPSSSTCSLSPHMQRDITATDVVLEPVNTDTHYIELQPEVKDDLHVKLSEEREREKTSASVASRLNKSETDLRSYRSRNGFYCDFARTSRISYHAELGENSKEERGSQIIVVKKCPSCVSTDSDASSQTSGTASTASSDFLSQYIAEDILAYL